jgi:hypothetical protein
MNPDDWAVLLMNKKPRQAHTEATNPQINPTAEAPRSEWIYIPCAERDFNLWCLPSLAARYSQRSQPFEY